MVRAWPVDARKKDNGGWNEMFRHSGCCGAVREMSKMVEEGVEGCCVGGGL